MIILQHTGLNQCLPEHVLRAVSLIEYSFPVPILEPEKVTVRQFAFFCLFVFFCFFLIFDLSPEKVFRFSNKRFVSLLILYPLQQGCLWYDDQYLETIQNQFIVWLFSKLNCNIKKVIQVRFAVRYRCLRAARQHHWSTKWSPRSVRNSSWWCLAHSRFLGEFISRII